MLQNNTTSPIEWITINRVCEITGYSINALREHKKKGYLTKDIHWIKRRGRILIHAKRFNEWLVNSPE